MIKTRKRMFKQEASFASFISLKKCFFYVEQGLQIARKVEFKHLHFQWPEGPYQRTI